MELTSSNISFLVYLTGAVCLMSIFLAYRKFRDSFHPSIYLSLLCFGFYVILPFQTLSQPEILFSLISPQDLEFVLLVNLLGIIFILAGSLIGSQLSSSDYKKFAQFSNLSLGSPEKMRKASYVLGTIALIAWVYTIHYVGGISVAYGRAYGGGSAESGYIRDLVILSLPAISLYLLSFENKKLQLVNLLFPFLCTLPLLVHGFLGARRGPTIITIVSLAMSWYLMKNNRPPLFVTIVFAFILGILIMFLVSNRGNIYLGSDANFTGISEAIEYSTKVTTGNEFVYGSGVLLNSQKRGSYNWGARYVTILFVRPIPKQLWPTKYDDAAAFFGGSNISQNLGAGIEELNETLGWSVPLGAAPGIIADMWIEVWFFAFPLLYYFGFVYGWFWKRAVFIGNIWIPYYVVISALSIYLITQTLEAMLVRFIISVVGISLSWRFANSD